MALPKMSSADPLSRSEFDRLLRSWLAGGDDERIAEPTRYGGAPWVWVRHGSGMYHLNADTKRAGVVEYVALLDRQPDLRWTVVEGRAGRMTKVVFGERQVRIPGFYLYRK